MIITLVTPLNIQIVFDLVEAKILAALLRESRPQVQKALRPLAFDGFDFSEREVVATAEAAAFLIGNYTDAVKRTECERPKPTAGQSLN